MLQRAWVRRSRSTSGTPRTATPLSTTDPTRRWSIRLGQTNLPQRGEKSCRAHLNFIFVPPPPFFPLSLLEPHHETLKNPIVTHRNRTESRPRAKPLLASVETPPVAPFVSPLRWRAASEFRIGFSEEFPRSVPEFLRDFRDRTPSMPVGVKAKVNWNLI